MDRLVIYSSEVLADIRSAAWLESELYPELNRHRRHEMADICEAGNVERVWRVLAMAAAEIRVAIPGLAEDEKRDTPDNIPECPDSWEFRFPSPLPASLADYAKEKIHEYLVARVMSDRAGVIIPEAAAVWSERAESAKLSLLSRAGSHSFTGKKVRRSLWPL